ncbi:hypothetical protein LTR53_005718 [Teratosphaeriaceae sp. CCFEE 6253]|nr:hypothetical protein LTR53_005718 [Teratosphaeriaceae sp. CCFEE 6253]
MSTFGRPGQAQQRVPPTRPERHAGDQDALEEALRFRYNGKPESSFHVRSGGEKDDGELYNWHRNTSLGVANEKYWKTAFNRCGVLITVDAFEPGAKGLERNDMGIRVRRLTAPSGLRKVKSVDDVSSPETSPKAWGPESPAELSSSPEQRARPVARLARAHSESAVPDSSASMTSGHLYQSASGFDWADEDQDAAWAEDLSRQSSTVSDFPAAEYLDTTAVRGESTGQVGDAETLALDQPFDEEDWRHARPSPHETDALVGVGAGGDDPDDSDTSSDYSNSPPESPALGDRPFSYHDADEPIDPVQQVRELFPNGLRAQQAGRPPSRRGNVSPDLESAVDNVEDHRSPDTSAETAPEVRNEEAVSPVSPTPSNASSVDSVTGMTQTEGLTKADAYWAQPKPSLATQRARLKYNDRGQGVVDRLPEDHNERIELLEAKVHGLRKERGALGAAIERLRGELNNASALYEECFGDNSGLQAELTHAEVKIEDLKKEVARRGRLYNELFNQYTEEVSQLIEQTEEDKERMRVLTEELASAKLDCEALESRVATLLHHRLDVPHREASTISEQIAASVGHEQTPDVHKQTLSLIDAETQTDIQSDSAAFQEADVNDMSEPAAQSHGDQVALRMTDSKADYPPILRSGSERAWPVEHVGAAAERIAEWINGSHQEHRGPNIDSLTPQRVRDILDHGSTSFFDLIASLRRAGYVFRDDRFAQDILRFARDRGLTMLEALYVERDLSKSGNITATLLKELDHLVQDAPLTRLEHVQITQLNELARQASKLEAQEYSLEDMSAKLKQCHEHGEQLQKDLSVSESTMREIVEQRAITDPCDSHRAEIAAQAAAIKEHEEGLQVQDARLKAQGVEISNFREGERTMSRQIEQRTVTDPDDGHQIDQAEFDALRSDHKRRERVTQPELGSHDSDASKKLESEIERLTSHVSKLNGERVAHYKMMQAARRTILDLEAIIERSKQPTAPSAVPQEGLPTDPPTLSRGSNPSSPTPLGSSSPTPLGSTLSARQVQRETRAKSSEAYKKSREALRQKHEAALHERERLAELRRQVYQNLCGKDMIPAVA